MLLISNYRKLRIDYFGEIGVIFADLEIYIESRA